MASGMPVADECVSLFTELKLKKTLKWIIFHIAGDKIVVEKSSPDGDSSTFKSALPKSDCRFAVFDAGSKIHFILWSPDNSPVKSRMVYASSKDCLHKKLDGAHPVALEAHELSDLAAIA